MYSYTGCIRLAFLHCVFSNVSSNCMTGAMRSHTGCIYKTFPQCALSNASSSGLPERIYSYTGCISLVFLHCAFSNVSSYCLPEMMQSHTACMYLCIFKCALKSALKGALWHWVHLFPSWKSFIWILEFGRRFFCVTCQIRRNYHVLEAWSSLKEGQKGCLIKTISDVNERPPEELHLIEIWSPEIHTI